MDAKFEDTSDAAVGAAVSPAGSTSDLTSDPPQRGIPPIAEALGYVGGALALAALITLLGMFWSKLGIAGHVGVGVALAAAGLIGGYVLGRHAGSAAQRLSQFLLFVGVAGVGFAAGFAVRDVLFTYMDFAKADAGEWGWFVGAAAIAVSGGLVWWRERSVLQHLAFGVGVAAAALLLLPLVPIEGHDWGAGATLVAVALVWGALSLKNRLEPRAEGLVLSALGIFGGIEMMALSGNPLMWALWLGTVACAALIWVGSHLEEFGVLGIGTVGLMVFSGQLVGEYLGWGAGTGIALVAVGFVLLGIGVRLILRAAPDGSRNRRVASEVAGYLGVALAMGGAGILLVDSWDKLGDLGRILIPLVGAGVAYGCGFALGRSESGTARRLSQVLLAIGVLCAGITAAMIARPIVENATGSTIDEADGPGNWVMFAGAATATLFGGVTWWLRKGALTQVALLGGVMALVVWAMNWGAQPDTEWMFGGLFAAVGLTWVVLGAAGRIIPVRTALASGCYLTLMGLQIMTRGGTGEFHLWAALLGIALGVGGVAASIYLKRAILLGFGAVFIMVFSIGTVMEVFSGAGAPVLLLVTGIVFIAVAVAVARIAPRIRETQRRLPQ